MMKKMARSGFSASSSLCWFGERGGYISYFILSKIVTANYPKLREVNVTIHWTVNLILDKFVVMQISDNRDKILLFLYKTLDARKSLNFYRRHIGCSGLQPQPSVDVVFGKAHSSHRFLKKKKKESDAGSKPSDLNERCSRTTWRENSANTPDKTLGRDGLG